MEKTVFVQKDNTVKLVNGETLELKKFNLKLMLVTAQVVSEIIKSVKTEYPNVLENFFDVKAGKMKPEYINQLINQLPILIPSLFPILFDQLVVLASAYTGLDKEQILEQWQAEDVWTVITPFFSAIMEQFNLILTKMTPGGAK